MDSLYFHPHIIPTSSVFIQLITRPQKFFSYTPGKFGTSHVFLFPLIFCLITGVNVAFRDAVGQTYPFVRTLLIAEGSTMFHVFLPYLAYILVVTLLTDRKNKDFDYMRQASILNYAFIPAIVGALLLVIGHLFFSGNENLLNAIGFINYLFCGWTYVLAVIAHSRMNQWDLHRSAILLAAPIILVWLIVYQVAPRMFMP